jgi:precorrin-4/cobalt-precorrin-4 C11-methyltransferase
VVFRASWPDERILRTTLGSLTEELARDPIERTAIIFVGRSLNAEEFRESSLYDAYYQRRFRGRGE